MNIPLPDILAKIKEQKGLDEAAINQKIDEKLEKLSGLVSKEGAAHILANELGVKLFENTGKIKDTYPGMRSPEVNGKVLQVYEINEFDRKDGTKGYVGNFIMGDETGTLRVVCWGDQAQILKKLEQGTIVKINDGVPKEGQRGTELHVSERTKVVVNPEGVEVQAYVAPEAVHKPIRDLTEEDGNVQILGTVVQVFEPKYFEVCPDCGGRLKQAESEWKCARHGPKPLDYSYVVNVFLDDGTENIRVALFRQQAEQLLGKSKEDMLTFRTSPELYEPLKTELLGEQYKISGRAKNNMFFNRLEFVAQNVEKATAASS